MPISNQQWRIEVGKFCTFRILHISETDFLRILFLLITCMLFLHLLVIIIFPMVSFYLLVCYFVDLRIEDYFFYVLIILCSVVSRLVNLFHFLTAYHANILRRFNNVFLQYTFFCQLFCLLPHLRILLLLCGDIESNPGPKTNTLNLCHWNLNSLAAHDFVKITHLESLAVAHSLDLICVSETFLDSSFHRDDNRLKIKGYEMIRSDFPGNQKRGGVCVYYREDLPIEIRHDLSSLDECLVLEIMVKRSKCLYHVFTGLQMTMLMKLTVSVKNLSQPVLKLP